MCYLRHCSKRTGSNSSACSRSLSETSCQRMQLDSSKERVKFLYIIQMWATQIIKKPISTTCLACLTWTATVLLTLKTKSQSYFSQNLTTTIKFGWQRWILRPARNDSHLLTKSNTLNQLRTGSSNINQRQYLSTMARILIRVWLPKCQKRSITKLRLTLKPCGQFCQNLAFTKMTRSLRLCVGHPRLHAKLTATWWETSNQVRENPNLSHSSNSTASKSISAEEFNHIPQFADADQVPQLCITTMQTSGS